ncbi:DnaJ domain-containing protein [Desulfonema magnum]|uniref:DnaJ domain-containing protein n=1 Tax=Desulfonema magnum TaxID=45655 RepID=A0A975BIL8_9BACT|nr:DnaJ domain-containing protein [Desulfonema magnum]QTA86016.1 DnaJ domain-containing protein [Desulfonema magnum]
MLTHYLTLGLSLDASDEDIRNSYLQLVKKYTPEKEPERFRQVTEAYEAIKDERNRIMGKIFGGLAARDYADALVSLGKAKEIRRRRVGLKELFQAEKKGG